MGMDRGFAELILEGLMLPSFMYSDVLLFWLCDGESMAAIAFAAISHKEVNTENWRQECLRGSSPRDGPPLYRFVATCMSAVIYLLCFLLAIFLWRWGLRIALLIAVLFVLPFFPFFISYAAGMVLTPMLAYVKVGHMNRALVTCVGPIGFNGLYLFGVAMNSIIGLFAFVASSDARDSLKRMYASASHAKDSWSFIAFTLKTDWSAVMVARESPFFRVMLAAVIVHSMALSVCFAVALGSVKEGLPVPERFARQTSHRWQRKLAFIWYWCSAAKCIVFLAVMVVELSQRWFVPDFLLYSLLLSLYSVCAHAFKARTLGNPYMLASPTTTFDGAMLPLLPLLP